MALRRDVATRAGVSLAVVSRVLNDSGYVAPEKRERVLRAVEELQYSPDPVARSLKSSRTNQILFYVRDLSNNYFRDMYRGMAQRAAEDGYNVIIGGSPDPARVRSLMVDGVIFPFVHAATSQMLARMGVPMVAACHEKNYAPQDLHVDVDVGLALRIAMDHLRDLGHRKIAYAAMDRSGSDLRLRAFLAESERNAEIERNAGSGHPAKGGHPAETSHPAETGRKVPESGQGDPRAWVFGPDLHRPGKPDLDEAFAEEPGSEVNYFEGGREAARQYLAGEREATAFLCYNDDTAIGLMGLLQEKGLCIPGDISVVGIDDHVASAYTSPPLTTVSIDPVRHGRECAALLVDILEGRAGPDSVQPPPIIPRLVLRGSCGQVP